MKSDQCMGPFPAPDQVRSTKRGPYKRGPKSTETGPVVGLHEDAPTALPPIIVPRNNIPNHYDREALADFYDGDALDNAKKEFDYLVSPKEQFSEKEAFTAVIYAHEPTVFK